MIIGVSAGFQEFGKSDTSMEASAAPALQFEQQ